jgi:hypothetical protein
VDIPIACSLTSTAAQSQLEEWRSVLAATVSGARRPSPTRLEFPLREAVGRDGGQLAAVVALARREQACCPFFGFALDIRAEEVVLQVTVPPDAVPILDGFAQLR